MGRWSFTVATNVISIDKAVIWMLAGAVSFTQLIWLLFISRSFRVRQLLFVRQRQIESHLGITKSISIDLFDESANVKDGVEWTNQFGFHGLTWTDISSWLKKHPEYTIENPLDSWALGVKEKLKNRFSRRPRKR